MNTARSNCPGAEGRALPGVLKGGERNKGPNQSQTRKYKSNPRERPNNVRMKSERESGRERESTAMAHCKHQGLSERERESADFGGVSSTHSNDRTSLSHCRCTGSSRYSSARRPSPSHPLAGARAEKRDKIAGNTRGSCVRKAKFRGIAFSSREFSSPAPRLPLALAQPPRTTPPARYSLHALYSVHASNRYFSEFVFNPATSCYGCRRVASVVIPDTCNCRSRATDLDTEIRVP
uniref:HDC16487 n=1 Tax=Drosophila melanogaster TaxID=7227 RepID=Q6IIZ1_DROME|nr:TPA_inf: HDC16487 [Drosophila melanogaster]